MNERLSGLLGMARRAGKLITGFDAVAQSMRDHRARAVLLAADLSEKTEKELRFAAEKAAVTPCKTTLTKEQLAHAVGATRPVGVVATEDRGFATAWLAAVGDRNEEDAYGC